MRGRMLAAALVASLLPAAAPAQSLDSLLKKGTVVLLERDGLDKFKSATAILEVNAPVDRVWAVLLDFKSYKDFMPTVVLSEVHKQTEKQAVVEFELEVPGPNTEYTLSYNIEPENKVIRVYWKDGDLAGSHWKWQVTPRGDGKSLIQYRSSTHNFSSLVESLEDEQQTATVGINVTSVSAAVKAVKMRAEGKK